MDYFSKCHLCDNTILLINNMLVISRHYRNVLKENNQPLKSITGLHKGATNGGVKTGSLDDEPENVSGIKN